MEGTNNISKEKERKGQRKAAAAAAKDFVGRSAMPMKDRKKGEREGERGF